MKKEQELLSFIDWLGLSLRLASEPGDIPGHVWREYSATNVWAKRRVLWSDEGDKVLTLLSEPRGGIIDSKAALLEVENEWLYHGGGIDAMLEKLIKVCSFEVMGISRLDLCVDFNPTPEQTDIIMGLAQDKYYVGGKRSGSGFWSTNTAECLHPDWLGKKIPHSQSWGHKTSDIKWKLYYKTRELWEAGGWKFAHKPYIIDQWREHDMDVSNVWRLEVSMKHLNNTQLYGQVVDLGVLRNFRAEFLVNLYRQRFVVRANESHKDRTNDKEIEFLPMPNIGKNVSKTPTKRLAEHSGRITLLRHLVTSLDDEHVFLDQPTRYTVFQAISDIVERDHLDNYFRAMTGMWLDDFIAKKDEEAVTEYDSREGGGNVLSMEEKGSSDAERRLDMPNWRMKYEMRPNLDYLSNEPTGLSHEPNEALRAEINAMQGDIGKMAQSIQRKKVDPQVQIRFEPPTD